MHVSSFPYLLRENIWEVNILGVVPGAHKFDRPHVRQVVSDNLAQLGEMPAVPITNSMFK